MIAPRFSAPLLLLLLSACHVDSTVGYNEGSALVGGTSCADAPLARCAEAPCIVSNVFDAPHGSITLAVDDSDIFFLSSPVSIGRRALDGGATAELATADSTLRRMTHDASHVYWTELNGNVRGVAKIGGSAFDAGYVFGNPTDIALDSSYLYWVLPEFGQIAMAPKPAGTATHLAGQDTPAAITADATHVYWVNAGSSAMTGQLMQAEQGKLASAALLLSGLDAPIAIAVSNDAVYWASTTAVFRLPKGETAIETVASGFTEVKAIGVQGATVYGVGMDGLWRAPARGGDWQRLERRPMSAMAMTCSGVYATGWFESALVKYGP